MNTEPIKLIEMLWFWRDVREGGKDELVWEVDNCDEGY